MSVRFSVVACWFLVCFISIAPLSAGDSREEFKVFFQDGVRYLQNGEIDKAIEYLEEALKLNSAVPQLYNLLGIAYMQKGGDGGVRAVEYLSEGLKKTPDSFELHTNLGNAYASIHDSVLAEEHFKKAVDLNPEYEPAHAGLGWLYLMVLNDADRAADSFESAVELNPENPRSQLGLGFAYAAQGKRANALGPLTKLRMMGREDLASMIETQLQEHDEPDTEEASGTEGAEAQVT